MQAGTSSLLLTRTTLRDYFHHSVHAAAGRQAVDASEETLHYVVELLVAYGRTENFYERTAHGLRLEPLAALYGEAIESEDPDTRDRALRRLGDLALFIAGVFAGHIRRKPVDVDYYVSMGERAYGCLRDGAHRSPRASALHDVFGELSARFVDFVEVLGEVSERTACRSDADLLRLYERWLRTGSDHLARRLRGLGIEPQRTQTSGARH